MATHTKGRRALGSLDHLAVIGTLNDAIGLFNRFKEGETFRRYLEERLRLVMPMCCLMLFMSAASGAGAMMGLGQMSHSLLLLGVVLLPVILVGSLFVQAYTFFTWLENRALAQRNHPAGDAGMGPMPPVPWGLAAALLLVPLALLAFVNWKAALVLVAILLLAPFLYALLDR
jgi:hypothetical protein